MPGGHAVSFGFCQQKKFNAHCKHNNDVGGFPAKGIINYGKKVQCKYNYKRDFVYIFRFNFHYFSGYNEGLDAGVPSLYDTSYNVPFVAPLSRLYEKLADFPK